MQLIWPEGEPEKAEVVDSLFGEWWLSFKWGLRGKRTRRTEFAAPYGLQMPVAGIPLRPHVVASYWESMC